jgi:hypothetical protein
MIASRPPSKPAFSRSERDLRDAAHLRQFGHFLNLGDDAIRDVNQVGTGRLVYSDAYSVLAVEMPAVISLRRVQLNAGDIAQAQPVGRDNEIANILDGTEFTARSYAQPLIAGS